jgi:diguanylate cyclase
MERDERQALRMRRYLMAAGTSLLLCLALFVFVFLGRLPLQVAVEGALGVVLIAAGFYLLFRTGLNQRFADPSLTTEQVAAAILWLAYLMYHAGTEREALALFYPVAMLFGVLRLNGRRLMTLAIMALCAHGTVLAVLAARDPQLDRASIFTEMAVLIIVLPWFAAMGGYVNRLRLRLSDSHKQLQHAFDRIEQLAIRDELTGAYNRRFMMECMARERSRAERLGAPFSICLIDVDHFKSVNDTLGHAAGDAVLRELPSIAAGSLRAIDVFGRFGGEEFLVVLPGTALDGARVVAERVRAAVAVAKFAQLKARQVTVTVGVAQHVRGEVTSDLTGRADRALYAGKAAGRNRVEAA